MTLLEKLALRLVALGAVLSIACFALPARADDAPLVVFAAASLKNALDDADAAWAKQGGAPVHASYAGSSALAKQIENGAPADVFISADLDWMVYLDKKKLVVPASEHEILGNSLVLIAPASSSLTVDIKPGFDLAGLLAGGRLAVAQPSVPAGKYGTAALKSLGVWDRVKDDLAPGDNVRAALLLVARGEAPLGIVYATDAAAEKGVKIVGTFPESAHPPIVYPAALTVASHNPAASAYLAFLRSPRRRALLHAPGFRHTVGAIRDRLVSAPCRPSPPPDHPSSILSWMVGRGRGPARG